MFYIIRNILMILFFFITFAHSQAITVSSLREEAIKLYKGGNYKDALENFEKIIFMEGNVFKEIPNDFNYAITCYRNLNRIHEIDSFREKVIIKHENNWKLLSKAAETYMNGDHYGYVIGNEFSRGYNEGRGRWVNAFERDRIQALRLMEKAMTLDMSGTALEIAAYYKQFANIIQSNRTGSMIWKLRVLTDINELPDYEEDYYGGSGVNGAPIDENGNPFYFKLPVSYESSENDGERWRWFLQKIKESNISEKEYVNYTFADFLYQQFGVHTMRSYSYYGEEDDGNTDETSNIFSLSSLTDEETIARLASGVKRFKLPDEYNFIKILKSISEENINHPYSLSSLTKLAEIYTNRRQYPKAADIWRKIIERFGNHSNYENSLNQIIKPWGMFEPTTNFSKEEEAKVSYRFRNGTSALFEAYSINYKLVLDDVRSYIKSKPYNLDWNKINIQDIGRRIVFENETKYIGEKVSEWEEKLEPLKDHFDKLIHIKTPIKNPGAYLLVAKMADGNTSRIIVWINDAIIIKKPLNNETLFFIADAKTGKPLSNAKISFFGYKTERVKEENILAKVMFRKYDIITKEYTLITNKDGICVTNEKDENSYYNWMITGEDDSNHFAYLGFTGIWASNYYDYDYNEVKTYVITDRPLYRPLQKVNFKIFIRQAKYDIEDRSEYANRNFNVEIFNPRNEKIYEKNIRSDEYGGISGNYEIPKNAVLGNYYINVTNFYGNGNTFRIEEYKKPEFEVQVEAPKEPVMLGEKIHCKIKALYYFGAPVIKAKVKYKVERVSYSKSFYPYGAWDWLYGPGYWWFAYDYSWYPGFYDWGIKRPHCFWLPVSQDQPELIAENEVEIGNDGTIDFEIDSSLAKAFHSKYDHEYSITAEVVDESRRTIVGRGSVIVARKPFKVYAWLDRGYYKTGDSITANFLAQTLDNKFVQGKGKLTLYKTVNNNDEIKEEIIEEWDLDTDERGTSRIQIKAAKEGQYRISYKVTDVKNHTIEGGYVFQIIGDALNDELFRFNDIEIIPDKKEYSYGEKASLIINTNQNNSTVLFFVRPANGVYLTPEIISINGQTSLREILITKKDMPNFFIEALTVSNGKIYTEIREIIVPPEKRILNIEILPSKNEFKPGESAKVKFKITDFLGNPFKGTLVASMYDKALEYISNGSNVPEIKAFFWKWRRQHYPNTETNIGRYFYNLYKKNEKNMQTLGVFGQVSLLDDEGSNISGGGRYKSRNEQSFMAKGALLEKKSEMDGLECEAPAPCMEMLGDSMKEMPEEAKTIEPTVRTNFADSAFWKDDIITDEFGTFEVDFQMPENITGWKMKVWGVTHGTKVGESEIILTTKKDLMLRLQAPRFFIEKDEVIISANIHNYLSKDKEVTAVLETEGDVITFLTDNKKKILIKANDEQRVDFKVKVQKEGDVVIRMKALTDEESDAMQMNFPSYIHGIEKTVSFSKVIRPEETESSINFDIPKERKIEDTSLEVRYSPSLAAAMVGALPYLAEYPYGCTEQTLNRFLPSVITRKVLTDSGIKLEDIKDMITNLNSQEIGNDEERMKQWKRWERNPVFDENELNEIIEAGIIRLYTMQLSDGGWGWFSGYGEYSSPHTTALIVHGLMLANEYGVNVDSNALDRGLNWLKDYQKDQIRMLNNYKDKKEPYKTQADNLDALIFMILTEANYYNKEMDDYLFRDKNDLSLYGKSLYGLGLVHEGIETRYKEVIKNISQFQVYDEENDSAYLNLGNSDYWWYWYGSEFEANAYYLKLLSKTDPKNKIAAGLVKYIINNRKHATYWNSTRDTAICIEALAEYMRLSGENKPSLNLKIYLDNNFLKKTYIDSSNLFSFDNQLLLKGEDLKSGSHTLKMEKTEGSPLYYNAYLSYFSLEDFIKSAGLEIKVNRTYYKLKEVTGNTYAATDIGAPISQNVLKYEREEIKSGDTLKSGDIIEIDLIVESKNDYEYLVIEDLKASGVEPFEVRSGYNGNSLNAYVEYRDDRVSFFIRQLNRGKHSLSYRVRAEIPGKFSALPAKMFAMYAPELKANSDEIKILIED